MGAEVIRAAWARASRTANGVAPTSGGGGGVPGVEGALCGEFSWRRQASQRPVQAGRGPRHGEGANATGAVAIAVAEGEATVCGTEHARHASYCGSSSALSAALAAITCACRCPRRRRYWAFELLLKVLLGAALQIEPQLPGACAFGCELREQRA